MVDIPTIEPFQFIRSTAFSERVQLANKLNEVIDVLNQIETTDDLQTQIDAINSMISEIQSALAETDSEVSSLSNQVNTIVSEVNGLLKEVVNEVVLDAPEYGQVRVKVIHEDETETASNALQIPVIVDGGISLISGTTARSFKIRYITADGVTHTTNDFVIPEGGGGTDVTVTSVTILEGDTDNSFKFEVGLSDGSSIQSNSYPFPAASELTPATTTQLGGIKVGTHLSVTADGTLSVDMTQINTAAVASTVMFTADSAKVTMHADSLAGSEFTKDIPQASQGGAGTIDQASYAKIAATEAKVNALAPTVTVNEEVSPAQITVAINGKSSTANLPSGASTVNNAIVVLGSTTEIPSNHICDGVIPDTITKAETSRNLLDPNGVIRLYSTIVSNNPSPFIFKNIYAFFHSTTSEKSTTTLRMGGLKDSSGFNATREVIANKYYPITYNFSISCFENGLPSSKRYIRLSNMVLVSGAGDFKNEGDNSFTDVIFDTVERNFKVQYGMTAAANNFQLYFSPLTEAFLSDTDTF